MSTPSASLPKPEQLTLLAVSDLPFQFRLDQRTRLRGLAHIAEIRQQLATRHRLGDSVAARPAPVAAHEDRAA